MLINYSADLKQAKLGLKVKAGAKNNKIEELILIQDKPYLKLSIKAAPENGKANAAIIEFLAKQWTLSRQSLEIISGHTNNIKILLIKNIELGYLNLLLSDYINSRN